MSRIAAAFVPDLVRSFDWSAAMIPGRKHINLSLANLLADGSQRVDVERVDQRPVQRGQAEHVYHAWQADSSLPMGKRAGARESENASHLALLETTGLAISAEPVQNGCVLDLCHK